MTKGIIKQSGTAGNYRYFFKGKPLDLENLKEIMAAIESGAFAGGNPDPMVTMQAALTLSNNRAGEVKQAIADYAKSIGANLDLSQITPVGVGISEPIVAKPKTLDEAKENMRVEFRIVKVDAETIAPKDFDF